MGSEVEGASCGNTANAPGWTMTHGDCLAGMRALPDDSIGVGIHDPPYEAEAHEKGKRQNPTNGCGEQEHGKRRVRVVDKEFDFPPITEAQRLEAAVQFARTTRIATLVFCQVEGVSAWRAALERAGLVYRRTIPWVKPDGQPSLHGRWPGQAFECLVLAMRPGTVAPIGGKARYYEVTRERGETRAHPTAKPLELMRQILTDFTLPGQLVLDAFAGSASTGIAAVALGRRFHGFELSRKYFDIACRRLRGEEAVPRECQPSLFGLVGGAGS